MPCICDVFVLIPMFVTHHHRLDQVKKARPAVITDMPLMKMDSALVITSYHVVVSAVV